MVRSGSVEKSFWAKYVFASGSPVFALALRLTITALILCWFLSCEARAQGSTFGLLHTFTGRADGSTPGPLIQDASGNLYGTTALGGEFNNGVVFQLAPTTSMETILYAFPAGGAKGRGPVAHLTRESQGTLYGTTFVGGDTSACNDGCGVVFGLTPNIAEVVLHEFSPDTGSYPGGGLVGDSQGNLYGEAEEGGEVNGNGVLFKINASGEYLVLHSFGGAPSDGSYPVGGLFRDNAGSLYGTTQTGGSGNLGTIFKLSPDGTESILHNFDDIADAISQLVGDAAGNIYGTTYLGGKRRSTCTANGCGVVFKVDVDGNYSVIYSFTGGPDGANPLGKLFLDVATGMLYGTTEFGGSDTGRCLGLGGCGTVFKLDAMGNETVLYRFTGLTDGFEPMSGVIGREASGGILKLFGAAAGGVKFYGTIFELDTFQ